MARILALETDRQRAATLQQRLRERLDASIVIATSTDAAIAAMADDPPDLVLTSTLLPPDEDQRLAAHLRQQPALRHLPVLTIPPIVELDGQDVKRGGVFSLLRKHHPETREAFDFQAVATRIQEALDQAKQHADQRRTCHDEHGRLPASEILNLTDQELRACCGLGARHSRARRWSPQEIPWLTGIKFSWGHDLRLLNISRSGVLVESGICLTPGNVTQFQLTGRNKDVFVTARVVRSRMSSVQALGVHYMSAAQFEQSLDALAEGRDLIPVRPRDPRAYLRQLVEKLRLDAACGASAETVRAKFEEGVHELVTAKDVRLRAEPVVQNDGRDSIYFTISPSHSPAILQITFEPNYRPGAEEFAALREASIAAASILECTKVGEHVGHN